MPGKTDAKPCSRCHAQPRKPKQSYCIECLRSYQREWVRRKHGWKARPVKPVVPPGMKFCTRCTRVLAVECFGKDASRPDGLTSNCKDCARFRKSVQRRRLTEAQKAEKRAYMREWLARHPGYNARTTAASKRRRLRRKMKEAARGTTRTSRGT